jgi:(R,R)-butanediol dehydrogenase / meso-butanediol dehydrogenase / diacetyl reductase
MQAVAYNGDRGLQLVRRPVPAVPNGCALIQVTHCGVSARDAETLNGRDMRSDAVPGREICGVVARSADVGLLPGTPVLVHPVLCCDECSLCTGRDIAACMHSRLIGVDQDGGFEKYVSVPAESCLPLPDASHLERFVIAFPLAEAEHLLTHAAIERPADILVLGSGPVGTLAGVLLSRNKGIRTRLRCTNGFQLNIALGLGVDCIDGRQAAPSGNGFGQSADVVLVTESRPALLRIAIERVRPRGRVVLASRPLLDAPIDFGTVIEKEVTIQGAGNWTREELARSIRWLAEGKIDPRPLITHRLPLEGAVEAIRILKDVDETMKVLVCPRGGQGHRFRPRTVAPALEKEMVEIEERHRSDESESCRKQPHKEGKST